MTDLRQYLQEDIKEFLENRLSVDYLKEQTTSSRIEDGTGFSRDFESELFSALQKHDVYQAKKVLHDVRDLFSTYPVGSVERRQLQEILRTLYEKFREYIGTENTLNKLEEGIAHVDDSHYFDEQNRQEKINTGQSSIPKPPEPQTASPVNQTKKNDSVTSLAKQEDSPAHQNEVSQQQTVTQQKQPRKDTTDSTEDQLLHVMHELKETAKRHDPRAKDLYLKAKQLYVQLSNNKKKLYQKQLLEAYKILTQIKHDNQQVQQKKSQQDVVPKKQQETETDAHKKFTQSLTQLQQAIDDKQFDDIKKNYSIIKSYYEKMSGEEKKSHKQTILSLYEKIKPLFTQSQNTTNNQTTLRQEPTPNNPQKQSDDSKKEETTTGPIHSEKKKLYSIEKQLRKAIDEGELHKAMLHYEELRDVIHTLPQKEQHEHVPRAHKYYEWLMKAWRQYHTTHPTINKHEQRLTGKP